MSEPQGMGAGNRLKVRASAVRQRLWRAAGPYYNMAIRDGITRLFRPAAPRPIADTSRVRVVGLLSTATGIGQSSRLCISALRGAGRRVWTHNVAPLVAMDHRIAFEAGPREAWRSGAMTIFHLNPPLVLLGMLASGRRRYYGGANVAYWAWELPELPPEWQAALRYVDAVLVPSSFCRDVLTRYTDRPVLVVPHPVSDPGSPAVPPAGDIRSGGDRPFRVLTVFNCGSSLYRKNPFAAIEAFKLAFGRDPAAELVLKVSDGRQHQADLALLAAAIGDAPNIRILDALMSAAELDCLYRTADAFISLHRAEGFGLSVAEAVMRQVPVVVTGWSGTADYCRPDLAFTVSHRLVPVDDPHPAYCDVRSAVWAEPSAQAAAAALRAVHAAPEAARDRAQRLKRHLLEHIADNSYARAVDALAGDRLAALPVAP